MRSAVVIDVNETMLDLAALDSLFADWFGEPATRREWFAQTLHFALTLAATRAHRSFAEAGTAALATVANRRRAILPEDAPSLLRDAMMRLPPHPDVAPALRLLRDNGLTTAALSNNPLPVVEAQMRHSGLSPLLDFVMSVDEAGALKPDPAVYQLAVARLDLPAPSIWMVAAHGWDIAGATRAGLRGAFVARPGQIPDPFAPPEITSDDLLAVARAILVSHRAKGSSRPLLL